jgi:hypothetical protein
MTHVEACYLLCNSNLPSFTVLCWGQDHVPVTLDGMVVGGARLETCQQVAAALRRFKVGWLVGRTQA